jgi:hypothetical protein
MVTMGRGGKSDKLLQAVHQELEEKDEKTHGEAGRMAADSWHDINKFVEVRTNPRPGRCRYVV